MKLENKFFTAFFYPFLICIILSSIVIIIILLVFTDNNLDNRTKKNIINLEKNYSKLIVNSAASILTMKFQKFQASLNELILLYQKQANELLQSNENKELNDTFLKCALTLDYNFCDDHQDEATKSAFWLLDNETTEFNLDEKKDVKQQLIAFSNIIQNMDATLETTKPSSYAFNFYFEKTELYASFPIIEECQFDFIYMLCEPLYERNSFQCLDENGLYYPIYKYKCENTFKNMMKSKTNSFDNNYLSNQNKTIFITSYYDYNENNYKSEQIREFKMCIEFDDPITNGKAYACVDASYTDLINPFDELNSQISGYFFVSNVGYNNLFYFPKVTNSIKATTEMIYEWSINYKLYEKINFHENTRKIFSSNYLDYIGISPYDEIFINGKNSSGQIFYINGEEFKYSIYPVTFGNLQGKKEHVMSLIYIYKEETFLQEMDNYLSSISTKIILVLVIFIVFGYGLLYIIYLTIKALAKYIVIPIKNVNYMLKGINIGGKKRLEFLEYLKKKQDDNIEKLSNAFLYENKKDNEESNIDSIDKYKNNYQDNDYLINKEKDYSNKNNNEINKYSDYDKICDEESDYIEKEFNFYDFDEQLLQYRSLDIEYLIKPLMDLKTAINITSFDREKEHIINYSQSEQIFRKFKNKEGAIICHSNIGNLQSQLLKFDKAIYHLNLSLQDNKLKKFLNLNLSDEIDEDDSLFNKISNTYNENKLKEKNNILIQKQINKSKNNYSQKLIGILINSRYPRLIYSYYMFFKNMQKLLKINKDIIKGQFMNTKFHTINYYHKILIQFIYLSYDKNDLVKIGESILNYIEFLIKFKFKTLSDDKYFLKIHNRNKAEFKQKQDYKKKIFDKIVNWFNLFDNYISYVKDNSSLTDSKTIIDYFSRDLNSANLELNLESQTTFMFKINIQKSIFLKGKFCLCCKNYNDALFYFINAAKKKSIVIDGLIKKRSLKHIYKLLIKMNKKCRKFGINNLNINKEIRIQRRVSKKKLNIMNKKENKEKYTKLIFGKELENIKGKIIDDLSECNAKQEKDIIILIDFNIYYKKEGKISNKKHKINSFIEETIFILNNYLSSSDRFSVLFYSNNYEIICPLMRVDKIDNNSFSKDLIYYKNKILNNNKEKEEFKNVNIKEDDEEFNLGGNILSDHSEEESLEMSENYESNYDKMKGLVKSINYIISYSQKKARIKNEKYFIIFTDMFDISLNEDKQIKDIFDNLNGDKFSTILLVGKNKNYKLKEDSINNNIENDVYIKDLILSKFGEKSESIPFENMKMIKTILSNNKVIKDQIFFQNEIYK